MRSGLRDVGLCVGLTASLLSCNVAARDWYVAVGGGVDSGPGTRAQPFATVSQANYRARAGDSIVLRGGYYRISQSNSAYVWRTGTANAWVTLRSEAGENAVLISTDAHPCTGTNQQYVEIRNITCTGKNGIRADGKHLRIIGNRVQDLDGANGSGISGGGSDVLIQGNIVERVRISGIRMGDNVRNSNASNRIIGNTVRYSGLGWKGTTLDGGWPNGVSIVGASDGVIENNLVEHTFGEGLGCNLSRNCRVAGNTVWDAYNALYLADNVTDSVWEGNVGWTTGDMNYSRTYENRKLLASGLVFGNERGWFRGSGNPTKRNIARNNVFINVQHGVRFANYFDGDTNGVSETLVANNTLMNTLSCGVHVSASLPLYANHFVNNVVVPAGNGNTECIFSPGVAFDHNLWAKGNPRLAAGAGDVYGMPQFVGTGATPRQYSLKSSSLGVDKGVGISVVPQDYLKAARPAGRGPDMGAFEYASPRR